MKINQIAYYAYQDIIQKKKVHLYVILAQLEHIQIIIEQLVFHVSKVIIQKIIHQIVAYVQLEHILIRIELYVLVVLQDIIQIQVQ